MKKIRILVVEDDKAILTGIADLLESEGYTVCTAIDGKEALVRYTQDKPTLILLDIMMPEKSGYDVCREIRKKDSSTPILMLTAKGQEVDKVIGLELGADDYIVKPFGINELLARIRVQLRRLESKIMKRNLEPISFGDVKVDPKTFHCTKGNKKFSFSSKELSLLQYLIQH
ncbi:MAG: response regulator transcription factor, partial [Candidatus Aminicenantes bacterium]|nr:response regulator transcription factor [Candidatus Aminicenantes bacterium]